MSSYQVFLPDAEEIRDHDTSHNGLVEENVDEHDVEEVEFFPKHQQLHKVRYYRSKFMTEP